MAGQEGPFGGGVEEEEEEAIACIGPRGFVLMPPPPPPSKAISKCRLVSLHALPGVKLVICNGDHNKRI